MSGKRIISPCLNVKISLVPRMDGGERVSSIDRRESLPAVRSPKGVESGNETRLSYVKIRFGLLHALAQVGVVIN